ncbi:MAG: hypothetical protein WBB32_02735 [Flavobacteriales bacterium]|nr:hypothetical protein [Flavobacteriales bacterium]
MITSDQLAQALQRHLADTPHFLVSAEVRAGGKALVEVDHDEAPITLGDLTAINKLLHEEFGEALDDLELQVSSPGLGRPFKVERQYRKRLGKNVEVLLSDGTSLEGVLEAYDDQGITLRILQPSKVKGRQPKLSDETTVIPFTGIKSTQASINLN